MDQVNNLSDRYTDRERAIVITGATASAITWPTVRARARVSAIAISIAHAKYNYT